MLFTIINDSLETIKNLQLKKDSKRIKIVQDGLKDYVKYTFKKK